MRTHFEIARAALEAGKHVLLEKPLAAGLSTAVKLNDAVQKSDKKLVPGPCLMLNPLS